jgi:hypothetical protein
MTLYVVISVKKPEYTRRYVTKVGAVSELQARKKFLARHTSFGGAQVETVESFVNWAKKHMSPSLLADLVIDEMVKESKHSKYGTWFSKFSSHTSADVPLTKDKLSKHEIDSMRMGLYGKFKDGGIPTKAKSLLRRALMQKISASKLTIFEVTR